MKLVNMHDLSADRQAQNRNNSMYYVYVITSSICNYRYTGIPII